MVDIRKKPFNLDDGQVEWVENTLKSMSTEEKIGQLFCMTVRTATKEGIDRIFEQMKPGGIMYRAMPVEEAIELNRMVKEHTRIPLLIPANLERGGDGVAKEGTVVQCNMGIAATDDVDMATKMGIVCGKEATAVGCNWAFAPVVDIDMNFRNPITNTRTFGNNPERVRDMGAAYVKASQANGIAACFKHFPGDGVDDRDQHLVTSINSLSCEEWMNTYGMVYKACIEAGALTCMVGHIMQPEWTRRLHPGIADEDIMPASLSPELMGGLLRGELGFQGLIVTDASTMAGFTIPMTRDKAVPYSIACGADMFLFTQNMEEDYSYMKAGVENGVITPERLDEAVTRILALKAALRLHERPAVLDSTKAKKVVGCEEHVKWAKECADRSVTLVKEEKGVLPLSTDKYKKILYIPLEDSPEKAHSAKAGVCDHFMELLKKEGFDVVRFSIDSGDVEGAMKKGKEYYDQFDLILYVANLANRSNQTIVRIEWADPMGANVPSHIEQIPTVFVSLENPYHLYDAPRVKTFINAYHSGEIIQEAVMDKLMGRSTFKGKSPVDPFCGNWDTHL